MGQLQASRRKVILLGGASAALLVMGFLLVAASFALLLPRLVEARANERERWRQAMAMADMHRISVYCHSYEESVHHFPLIRDAEAGVFTMTTGSLLKQAIVRDDAPLLCPVRDPWGEEYHYGVTADGSVFVIICYGLDGRWATRTAPDEHVGTHCFEDDIIWLQDRFIQEPEGVQRKCSG